MERQYIQEVLRHTGGQIAGKGGAAEILGLPPSTLRSRMMKLGLKQRGPGHATSRHGAWRRWLAA
jgi:transcriptional regulator with GAF, ATPase, and Fis domain